MIITTILFWLITFFLFARILNKQKLGWDAGREPFVWASIVWGMVLVAIIESLSLFNAINSQSLMLAWLAASLVVILAFGFIINNRSKGLLGRAVKEPVTIPGLTLLLIIGLIVLISFFIALATPPNNYDAMSYHLARVAHWTQNGSLAHYPASNLRQLAFPPGAELIILNFYVLMGSDLLANIVQWLSMLGSLIVISLTAKTLGANLRGQIYSAFLGVTIPMGIAQSMSTQNDYVCAFWVICFVYFVVKLRPEGDWLDLVGAALSLGLAWLTKPTAYIFAFPFIVWLLIKMITAGKGHLWKLLAVLLVALTINSGYFIRNYQLFGSPFGGDDYGTRNKIISPGNIVSNILKYSSLNFNTPLAPLNHKLYLGVAKMSQLLGVDLNDRRTSDFEFYNVSSYAPHEDLVGNPVHFMLIFLCLAIYLFRRKQKPNPVMSYYAWALIGAFFLLFLPIKYQPWLNRYLLSLFVLASPFAGAMMERVGQKKLIIIWLILLAVALPPLVMNIKKPLFVNPWAPKKYQYSIFSLSRAQLYLVAKPETYGCYEWLASIVKTRGYHDLGLVAIDNEYPLWAIFKANKIDFRLEHVGVENISKRIPIKYAPQAVIVFGDLSKDRINDYENVYSGYKKTVGRDSADCPITIYGL